MDPSNQETDCSSTIAHTHAVLLPHAVPETRTHPLLRLSVVDAELISTTVLMRWCATVALYCAKKAPVQRHNVRPEMLDDSASRPPMPPARTTPTVDDHYGSLRTGQAFWLRAKAQNDLWSDKVHSALEINRKRVNPEPRTNIKDLWAVILSKPSAGEWSSIQVTRKNRTYISKERNPVWTGSPRPQARGG